MVDCSTACFCLGGGVFSWLTVGRRQIVRERLVREVGVGQ